jgi:putative molybdopterin biosynthesis protein
VATPRFHSALRELRVKAGLQQRELAERVGVSRQTLGTLESGESVPATSIALELARVLGCRVEDIFWLDEEESPLDALLVGRGDEPAPRGQPLRKRVALAAVDDRWVAHLLDGEGAGAFAAPADGILASGGRREGGGRAVRVRPLRESKSLRENLFCAGCDPALALLASPFRSAGAAAGCTGWRRAAAARSTCWPAARCTSPACTFTTRTAASTTSRRCGAGWAGGPWC